MKNNLVALTRIITLCDLCDMEILEINCANELITTSNGTFTFSQIDQSHKEIKEGILEGIKEGAKEILELRNKFKNSREDDLLSEYTKIELGEVYRKVGGDPLYLRPNITKRDMIRMINEFELGTVG